MKERASPSHLRRTPYRCTMRSCQRQAGRPLMHILAAKRVLRRSGERRPHVDDPELRPRLEVRVGVQAVFPRGAAPEEHQPRGSHSSTPRVHGGAPRLPQTSSLGCSGTLEGGTRRTTHAPPSAPCRRRTGPPGTSTRRSARRAVRPTAATRK